MEAQMIHAKENTSSHRDRFRIGLIVSGILVAIIVSIFLVHDARPEAGVASLLPQFSTTTNQVVHQSASLGVEHVTSAVANLFHF